MVNDIQAAIKHPVAREVIPIFSCTTETWWGGFRIWNPTAGAYNWSCVWQLLSVLTAPDHKCVVNPRKLEFCLAFSPWYGNHCFNGCNADLKNVYIYRTSRGPHSMAPYKHKSRDCNFVRGWYEDPRDIKIATVDGIPQHHGI